MKICKSCRLDIDEHATKCPNCLTDQRNWFFRHPILSVVSIVFFVSLFINKKPKESKYTQHIPRKSYPQNFLRDNIDVQDDTLNNDVPIEHRNALIKANYLLIQFHNFESEADKKRNLIIKAIEDDFTNVFTFEWMWELWIRKGK